MKIFVPRQQGVKDGLKIEDGDENSYRKTQGVRGDTKNHYYCRTTETDTIGS